MKFKPKLTDIIKEYNMDHIVLVPKNRGLMNDFVKNELVELGINIDFEDMKKNEYKNGGLTIYRYRGEDIPKLVDDFYLIKGKKVMGISGDDLFDEYQIKNPNSLVENLETIDWYDKNARYGRPALCLIKKSKQKLEGKVNIAIERKFENTGREYLKEANDGSFEPNINVYSGNSEQTIREGLNDACIDVVYSGKTIEDNGLDIGAVIRLTDLDILGINENSPRFKELIKNNVG